MSVFISAINTLVGKPKIEPQFQRELRRADDFIQLAVLSVHGLPITQLPLDDDQSNQWGLVVGSSFGPMETNFVVLDQIVKDEQTSPTYFSHSVFNGAAGYLTRIFNIRGYTATLTDFFYPFFQALSAGCQAVDSGLTKKCLIVQVESYSDVLHDAKTDRQNKSAWPMGAAVWLIESDESSNQSHVLNHIKTEFTPRWQPGYLRIGDNLIHNGEKLTISHPLQPVLLISQALAQPEKKENYFQIQSPNGFIELQTGQLT